MDSRALGKTPIAVSTPALGGRHKLEDSYMGPLLPKSVSFSDSATSDDSLKRRLTFPASVNGVEGQKGDTEKKVEEKNEDYAATIRCYQQQRMEWEAVESQERVAKEQLLFTDTKNYAKTELEQTKAHLWQSIIVIMSDVKSAGALGQAVRQDPRFTETTIAVQDVKGAIAVAAGQPRANVCFVVAVPTVAGCAETIACLGAAVKGATIVARPKAADADTKGSIDSVLWAAGFAGSWSNVGVEDMPSALARL
jgi:hypothetical protein